MGCTSRGTATGGVEHFRHRGRQRRGRRPPDTTRRRAASLRKSGCTIVGVVWISLASCILVPTAMSTTTSATTAGAKMKPQAQQRHRSPADWTILSHSNTTATTQILPLLLGHQMENLTKTASSSTSSIVESSLSAVQDVNSIDSSTHENQEYVFQILNVKDSEQNDAHYATVSVIDTTSNGHAASNALFQMLGKNWSVDEGTKTTTVWKATRTPLHNAAAWHTLSLVSDVLVVLVDDVVSCHRSVALFWDALGAGWRRRRHPQVGLSRARLVIVVRHENNNNNKHPDDTVARLREAMVLQRPEWTPDVFSRLDIMSFEDYCRDDHHTLLSEFPDRSTTGTCTLMDREVLEQVVRQAYARLGGDERVLSDPTEAFGIDDAGVSKVEDVETMVNSSSSDEYNDSVSDTNKNPTDLAQLVDVPKYQSIDIVATRQHRSGLCWGFLSTRRLPFFRHLRNKTSSSGIIDSPRNPRQPLSEREHYVLQSIFTQLDNLRMLQEDNLLDDDLASMPIDFASRAGPILDELASFSSVEPVSDSVIHLVETRLRELFQQHLERLRDHYGKMYETLLDHQHPKTWDAVRTRVVTSFRDAASRTVPKPARKGSVVRTAHWDDIAALAGLESDLDAITELRRGFQDDGEDDENDIVMESASRRRQKRIMRLCKRLAARSLMLGINYAQGWLAWQGIKYAALERERNFPKFPLF